MSTSQRLTVHCARSVMERRSTFSNTCGSSTTIIAKNGARRARIFADMKEIPMTKTAGHAPSDYHSVTPYLILDGAAEAITFYERAFGARQLLRLADPDGKIRHAEIQIGNSPIMLVDASLHNAHPQTERSDPPHLYLYVDDADGVVDQAVAAGAKLFMPVEDQGDDRRGGIVDPFGHVWYIGSRLHDLSREELQARFDATQSATSNVQR